MKHVPQYAQLSFVGNGAITLRIFPMKGLSANYIRTFRDSKNQRANIINDIKARGCAEVQTISPSAYHAVFIDKMEIALTLDDDICYTPSARVMRLPS